MRTTVTLDQDVENLLRQVMQKTGQTFKATLNRAIRRGLADIAVPTDEAPFTVAARSMGLRAGVDPSRLNQINDELQVDAFLEVAGTQSKSQLLQGSLPKDAASRQ